MNLGPAFAGESGMRGNLGRLDAFPTSQPERRFIGAPENGLAAAFARAKVEAKEIA
jgi:hypothetical protein